MPSPLLVPASLLNLLVLGVALVASRRQLAALVPRGRRERDALLLVLALALLVRVANPFRPLPWMAEGFYADQTEGMLIYRLNGICSTGEMVESRRPFSLFLPLGERGMCRQFAVFYPSGYPFMLAIASSLLGFGTAVPRVLGVLGGTLTVALTYLLARALTRDDRVALTAALVLALLPMHVRFGVKMLSEVFSVLVEVLAVLAAVVHVRSQRSTLGWLVASALAFHITVRRENPIAAIPIL
ncbi:MAG: glycosyltransferase family 39 protein, partial [Methanopyri archaeon]|nr:glycosyltransferase family 39 protein [Methanopyri archaeon]